MSTTARPRRTPWGVVDQFVSAATNSVAVLVAAHRLDPTEFGRLAVCIVGAMILITASRAFTSSPFVLDHAAEEAGARRESLSAAIAGGVRVGSGVAVAFVIAAILVGTLGDAGSWTDLLVVLALGAVPVVVQDLSRHAFFVVGPAWGAAVSDAVWLVVFLVPALVFSSTFDTAAALLGLWLLGAAVGGCAAWVVLRRSAVAMTQRWRTPWIRPHLRLSLNVLADLGLVTIYGYSIPLIVAVTADVEDAGLYRLAQTVIGPVMILVSSMTLELLPRLVQAAHRGEPVVRPAARAGMTISALAVVTGVVVAVIPDAWMTTLIGPRWTDAATVTVVLAASASITALGASALLVLRASGGQPLLTRTRAILFPLNLALVLVGAVTGGATGAAVGLLISNLVGLAPWWWLALRHVRSSTAVGVVTTP